MADTLNAPLDNNLFKERTYTRTTINQAFNDFLDLQPSEQKLVQRYHETLMRGGETFAKIFYDYLMTSPVTAKVLEEYQMQGGLIADLVKQQLQHLFGFLSGKLDEASAQRMAHIGAVHHRYGIEPVWIMGAYKLYLDHLQKRIRNSAEIKESDRHALENTVTKLLFRDMGLMLEGYWDAGQLMLTKETEKVIGLRDQITSLLSNIPQLLWSIDIINNRPLYVSPTAQNICGMDIDLPIPCMGWTIPEDKQSVELAWQNALRGIKTEVESRVKQPDGELRWFRRLFYPYMNGVGDVVRIDGLMEDTTELKATLERLNSLATTDSLTGLTNRTLFHDRLTQAIEAASRSDNQQVVMMLLDLDRFKEINDTLGHHSGDKVLIEVGQRLQAILRKTDTLARLGGDEFGILLPQVKDGRHTSEKIAKKIQQAFVSPYHVDDNELFLGVSTGITIYPEHGEDVTTLMRRADVAMYSTKGNELGYMFYDAELDPHAQKNLLLSGDLRHALERNELVLHYQPKIDLKSGRIKGAEALIRWQHPERGLISPDEFISLAERTGLIKPITDWIIETAVKQSKAWRNSGYELKIAVNVSARSFQSSESLVGRIDDVLKSLDMPADSLEIEITENLLMTDISKISSMLKQISDLGVTIAIDDFGTGYSSLAYLKTLPLHTLKIDKSFVLDMNNDENDAVIVRSTIDLAHNLGFSVVAEGIENSETLDLLIILGCDGAQGYHFSRPLSSEKFLFWLQQQSLPLNI